MSEVGELRTRESIGCISPLDLMSLGFELYHKDEESAAFNWIGKTPKIYLSYWKSLNLWSLRYDRNDINMGAMYGNYIARGFEVNSFDEFKAFIRCFDKISAQGRQLNLS